MHTYIFNLEMAMAFMQGNATIDMTIVIVRITTKNSSQIQLSKTIRTDS